MNGSKMEKEEREEKIRVRRKKWRKRMTAVSSGRPVRGSSGSSGRTFSRKFPEEVVHPEEFQKTRSSGRTFKFPEDLSERTTSSGSGFFVV